MRQILILFLLFNCAILHAQDSIVKYVGGSFAYHPTDFILSANAGGMKNNWSAELGFGIGVNRTVFQQRFSPWIYIESAYSVNLKHSVKIFPLIRLQYNYLNIGVPEAHPSVSLIESYLGGGFSIGEKSKIGIKAIIGPALEFKWNDLTNRKASFFQWNYQGLIVYSYVL